MLVNNDTIFFCRAALQLKLKLFQNVVCNINTVMFLVFTMKLLWNNLHYIKTSLYIKSIYKLESTYQAPKIMLRNNMKLKLYNLNCDDIQIQKIYFYASCHVWCIMCATTTLILELQ